MAEIVGTEDSEALNGGAEADLITGLEGNDSLDGRGGLDTLRGGIGDDVYILRQPDGEAQDVIEDVAGEGVDTIIWIAGDGYIENEDGGFDFNPEATFVLPDNVENLIVDANLEHSFINGYSEIIGNGLDNVLTAGESYHENDGSSDLYVLADADLHGEGGDDTLNGGGGFDYLDGGEGDDLLVGKVGNDDIAGLADTDILDGGEGADTMIGGSGADEYWADQLGDVIIDTEPWEPGGPPPLGSFDADTLYWTGAGSFVLPDNVELMFLQDGADQGVGNGQGNYIHSRYGDDFFGDEPQGPGDVTVDGAGGDDTLAGGERDEATGLGGDDLLLGGDGNDLIAGRSGDDQLRGGDGSDEAVGDDGDDSLAGDGGDDWLSGDGGSDFVAGGEGADILFGGEGDDTLEGGAAQDRFHGGLGADLIEDFTDGEDLLLVQGGMEAVTEIRQEGADTLVTFADGGVTRLAGVDAGLITEADFLVLLAGSDGRDEIDGGNGDDLIDACRDSDIVKSLGGNDLVHGGAGNDSLDGGEGNDTLDGGGGRDRLTGGAGADTFVLDTSKDVVVEKSGGGVDTVVARFSYTLGTNLENLVLRGAVAGLVLEGTGNGAANGMVGSEGDDRLWGLGGRDTLAGGTGHDLLRGGGGGDLLLGGPGRDKLAGGGGGDEFRFLSLESSGSRILDYDGAEQDRVDISAIDANVLRGGDQAARIVEALTGRAGQAVLAYDAAHDRTEFRLDTDGDAAADFVLTFRGHVEASDAWAL
ncbi:MAG TPA: calcium-binding protein [Caulobacteraceae bacterium]|jgi:Ca2+-binding RTX toxin-like protein